MNVHMIHIIVKTILLDLYTTPWFFFKFKRKFDKKNMYGDEEGRVYMHHDCMNKREFSSRTQNLHTNSGCHNL